MTRREETLSDLRRLELRELHAELYKRQERREILAEVRRIKREIAELCELAVEFGDVSLGDQVEKLEAELDKCLGEARSK